MQLFGTKKNGKHSSGHKAETEKANLAQEEEYVEMLINEPNEESPAAAPVETSEKVKGIVAEREKSKKKKVWKTILIIFLVLAVLAAAAYVVIEYFLDPPEIVQPDESTPIEHVENRKDGVYTFLVAGVDQISNNTDTIMVGSFDIVNHKLNIASIPRDTLINIKHEVKKANSAYHYAEYYSKVEGSSYYGMDPVQSMRQELIKNMMGFDVDSYVLVNLDACSQVVDAIGGVQFDVPINMNYDSKPQDLHIHISKGPQTLSGEQFIQVMRFRSAYSGGDLDRIEMQHKLLKALAEQMLTLKNIPNITEVIKIVTDNMQTYMTGENILFFIKEFLKLDKDGIEFMTMPKLSTGSIYGQSYVFTDVEAWLKMVNEKLNPWTEEVTPANVNIVTFQNGNFYSTIGELYGGVGSFNVYSKDSTMDAAQVLMYESPTTDNEGDNTNDVTQ